MTDHRDRPYPIGGRRLTADLKAKLLVRILLTTESGIFIFSQMNIKIRRQMKMRHIATQEFPILRKRVVEETSRTLSYRMRKIRQNLNLSSMSRPRSRLFWKLTTWWTHPTSNSSTSVRGKSSRKRGFHRSGTRNSNFYSASKETSLFSGS